MSTLFYIVEDTMLELGATATVGACSEIEIDENSDKTSPQKKVKVERNNSDAENIVMNYNERQNTCFDRSRSVYKVNKTSLQFQQIVKIMEEYVSGKIDCVITQPPVNPRGGEIYVYKLKNEKDRDYLYDKLPFNQNARVKVKSIDRLYYSLRNPAAKVDGVRYLEGFTKQVYRANDSTYSKDIVIIQYLGDHTIINFTPVHGNSKKRKGFYKTIKEQDDSSTKPEPPITKCEQNGGGDNVALSSEDLETVANSQPAENEPKQLRKCDIFAILELLNCDFDRFITDFHVNTDYTFVACMDTVAVELTNHLLQLSMENQDLGQFLSYEAVFEIGEFLVSTVTARNIKFEDDPLFPVAFILHNSNEQSVHEDFWSILANKLQIEKCGKLVPICIQREECVKKAIAKVLPNCQTIITHNEIEQDAADWLNRKTVKEAFRDVYEKHVENLLLAASEDEFNSKYSQYSSTWFKPFREFVESGLITDIRNSAMYNIAHHPAFEDVFPDDDISEMLISTLRQHTNTQQLSMDGFVLSLYDLQMLYLIDFEMGERDTGVYQGKYKPRFKRDPFRKTSHLPLDPIVMKDPRLTFLLKNRKPFSVKDESGYRSTARKLAEHTIQQGQIVLEPKTHSFIVRSGFSNDKFLVDISDQGNETCSCSSTGLCYHIIAVYLGIGLEPPTGDEDDHSYELAEMLKRCI